MCFWEVSNFVIFVFNGMKNKHEPFVYYYTNIYACNGYLWKYDDSFKLQFHKCECDILP